MPSTSSYAFLFIGRQPYLPADPTLLFLLPPALSTHPCYPCYRIFLPLLPVPRPSSAAFSHLLFPSLLAAQLHRQRPHLLTTTLSHITHLLLPAPPSRVASTTLLFLTVPYPPICRPPLPTVPLYHIALPYLPYRSPHCCYCYLLSCHCRCLASFLPCLTSTTAAAPTTITLYYLACTAAFLNRNLTALSHIAATFSSPTTANFAAPAGYRCPASQSRE
ncbi:hypothetical protein BHE74_00046251 [Ensete ventricosum]|nr:hypothetical protein GW17_00036633 [Ensete ventricosum]RWW47728.1 hypothetical protein BHE74_00046251 [Ensete ventricosum]